MTVEEVIARLERRDLSPKRRGDGQWEARCPAHDDRTPSLSIGIGRDGRTLLDCHAGCDKMDVLAAMGLGAADLFAATNGNGNKQITATYDYIDERGELLFQVVRFRPKDFRQRRPDGNGDWLWKLGDTPRVLYRLPAVIAARAAGETIYVAEGEKDVHALERVGVTATTNPGGAGKWREEYAKALAGATVIVIADRDDPGRDHAKAVADSLRAHRCTVRLVEAAQGKDAADHQAAGLGVEDFRDAGPPEAGSPRAALQASRVDLIARIETGIPEREYVPGAPGLLPKAKRIHATAGAKTGKSLALGGVTAIEVIAAGGRVAVLDRENGADECARRLEAVLDARDADAEFREQVRERLAYYDWPSLSLDWREDPTYPAEFTGADVVIFDSSRSHTAPLGLQEDASDDWAAFTTALIDPLMKAGITTITLDNTGHENKERSRGTSAKADLCDLAFTLKTVTPFSATVPGRLQLRCTASRIGEVTVGDAWQMELGGGTFGSWQPSARAPSAGPSTFRPTGLMEKTSRAVEQSPGLGKRALRAAVGGARDYGDLALDLLVKEGNIEVQEEGQKRGHRVIRPYREAEDSPTVATVAEPWLHRGAPQAEGTVATVAPPCREHGDTATVGDHGDRGGDQDLPDGWTEDSVQALIDGERQVG